MSCKTCYNHDVIINYLWNHLIGFTICHAVRVLHTDSHTLMARNIYTETVGFWHDLVGLLLCGAEGYAD